MVFILVGMFMVLVMVIVLLFGLVLFISEFLVLLGIFSCYWLVVVFGVIVLVFLVVYMLWFY